MLMLARKWTQTQILNSLEKVWIELKITSTRHLSDVFRNNQLAS